MAIIVSCHLGHAVLGLVRWPGGRQACHEKPTINTAEGCRIVMDDGTVGRVVTDFSYLSPWPDDIVLLLQQNRDKRKKE